MTAELNAAVDQPGSQTGDESLPLVSIVMPIRNEAKFITRNLDDLLAQDYPSDRMEIIVADGMSDDGTRDILARYCAEHPRVRMVDNPGRIVSTGLNRAIEEARADIICRIDGHCHVAPDFIRQNVQLLAEHPEAWVTGGPIVHAGKTAFGKAVAIAMSHPCGVGMATHRFPNYEGYVEGAQFPTIRRFVFDRIGKFDERLVRNQDDEFNCRINLAGGKSFISPRVKYVYYVRDKWRQLFRQYFQYSFWRIPVIRKHKRPTTLRQMAPPLFYVAVVALAVAGFIAHLPWLGLVLPAIYVAVLIGVGLSQMPRAGVAVGCLIPVALATMHFAYAAGMYYGAWSAIFHRHAWDTQGSMATLSR